MKNLFQLGEKRRSVSLPDPASPNVRNVVDVCQALTEEYDSDSATIILTNDGLVSRIKEDGETSWSCNLDEINAGGGWFSVSYIDPELVCLSRNGAIVTVSPTTGEAELVGVFDHGLEAACWSPDGEVLLMVTSVEDEDDESKINSVLMSMNSQFEVLSEVTIPPYVPSSSESDCGIALTWRPDGSLCALICVDKDDNMRKVRIYKRDTLELHAIGRSEDASGDVVKKLQDSGLAWAGAGCSQLLAAVQRKGKKTLQVVFFESNGLRHRELVLREASTTNVMSLNWNSNSDLLAVCLREDDGSDKIQLWHRCNYHWYLKRELRYPGQTVQRIKFSEEKASELCVVLSCQEWREYEMHWDPSTTLCIEDKCTAFVVDGCMLNITPLERALIPPPMSMGTVKMEFPVHDLCFCRNSKHAGSVFVQMSDGNLKFLTPSNAGPVSYKEKKIVLETQDNIDLLSLRSFVIVGATIEQLKVIAIAGAPNNSEIEKLVEFEISSLDTEQPLAKIVNTHTLEDRVLRMVQWSDSNEGAFLELRDGSLLEFQSEENGSSVIPSSAEPLLEPCPWICAIKNVKSLSMPDEHDERHSRLVFGLSTKFRLYFHDMMLTDSASSLFLSTTHEYLCYATAGSRCQLRFLPLKEIKNFDPLMGLDHNEVLEGYEPRNVERGARLVAVMPSKPMAVLQMPRGNLEGIYPRALILRFVMNEIITGEYGDAFRMMRKHKVDLNLLCDFDPIKFLNEGIKMFLQQVPNIDHLNLFISGLQNFDITQTRFPVPGWIRSKSNGASDGPLFDFSTKVNQVCTKAHSTMMKLEEDGAKPNGHFLLPILSTYAKEDPPRLDEALNLIKANALKAHPATSSKPPLFAEKAQSSIHYLAFLAEYELLFETALGMYDFEIARAVARNSQMDPKVYLPLLKRLNALPTHYGRFEVDVRLQRYEAALRDLYESYTKQEDVAAYLQDNAEKTKKGNKFEDCLLFIEKHGLHKIALELFNDDNEQRQTIFVSLGEYLLKSRKSQAALSVFLAADPPHLDGAKRAARSAGDWRQYFTILEKINLASGEKTPEQLEIIAEQRRQAAREIATSISETATSDLSKINQDIYSNAALILRDYGDDLIGAVDMLESGRRWSEAHRIASLHSRDDLIKKCIDSAEAFAYTLMDEFEEKATSFKKASDRYAEVLKLRKQTVYVEGPDPVPEEETGSLFSAASTMSNMSLRSTSSTASTNSSVSSIISIKSATTFTMTGGDEGNRHRSKFNKGKRQKKHKKKRKSRKQNAEQELKSVMTTLRYSCANSEYAEIVAETIRYLIFVQQTILATNVFKRFNSMRDNIEETRQKRIEATRKEKAEAERKSRMEGDNHDDNHLLVELPFEKEIDELICAEFPTSLQEFFDLTSI